MNLREIFNLDRFKQKLGPLPVWAWGLIIGAFAILIYYVWIAKKGDAPTDGISEEDANFAAADEQQSAFDSGFADYISALDQAAAAPAPVAPVPDYSSGSYEATYAGGGGYEAEYGATPAPASYAPPVRTPIGKTTSAPLIAPKTTVPKDWALERIQDQTPDPYSGLLNQLFDGAVAAIGSWFGNSDNAYNGGLKAYDSNPIFGTSSSSVPTSKPATKAQMVATVNLITTGMTNPPPASIAAPTPPPAVRTPDREVAQAQQYSAAQNAPVAAPPPPAPTPPANLGKTSTGRPVNKGMF